ncbi:MAG TPA: hypothetical protein VFP36_03525 [Usitatibacter sp.]|nr:hypothetical protein [Usitatibacter sp.]
MANARRIAVLGLYNSGSTGVADMLHHLGVCMAPPFWEVSDSTAENNFYEPYELSWHLRKWWDEPRAVEQVPASVRVNYLRQWALLQESLGASPVIGATHPLLSLCGEDLLEAWGADTRFLWSWRPLAESIAGLERREWFAADAGALQRRLWDALERFDRSHPRLAVKLDWNEVKADPVRGARALAAFAGIDADEERVRQAAARIRPQPTGNGIKRQIKAALRKAMS